MSDTEKEAAPPVVEEPKVDDEEMPEAEKAQSGDEEETAASPEPSPKKNSPMKSPKKTPERSKGDDEEDESEDSDDEEHVGLLDGPVVIQEGKRERKKTERMTYEQVETPSKKSLEIPEGSGTKLGDCPRIEHFLNRTKAPDCKNLHKVLYGCISKATETKKNIRKFCGFSFEKDSADYEKKKSQISKMFTAPLKEVCILLDLERKGTKENIVDRIMEFLMSPAESGKKLPQSKRKSSKSPGSRKRKRKSKGSKSDGSKSDDVGTDESGSDVDDEEDEGGDGDNEDVKSAGSEDDEEEEKPKAKKRKTEKPKKEKKPKKDKVKKEKKAKSPKTPKKDKKAVTPKKRKVTDDSDSDDEPLVKKKSPPTDDDLKDIVKRILDGADLEEVTMKTVLRKVYDKFPDYDLSDRKDFIKTTVKEIIS